MPREWPIGSTSQLADVTCRNSAFPRSLFCLRVSVKKGPIVQGKTRSLALNKQQPQKKKTNTNSYEMATTSAQRGPSRFFDLPPLPSSKKHMETESHSTDTGEPSVAQCERGESSSQRGESACKTSRFPDVTDGHETNTSTTIDLTRALVHSRATTIPLKRRRSLPCPKSVPANHFLKAISIDDCNDLLSIPDPPTPKASYSTAHLAHRATGASVPLRDLSNGSPTMNKRNASSMSSRTAKRSRLSLPNMASPLVSNKKKSAPRICTADNYLHTDPATEALRIQIPERVVASQQQSGESKDVQKEAPSFQMYKAAEKSPDIYEIPTQPETEKLLEIRQLVHAYTSLPKEQRYESKEAKDIEDLTGYPVVPSFVPAGAVSEADKHERRQDIITDLPARMKHVDDCKGRDARLMQEATQCCVRKLRGGYVEYSHAPSGRHVPPEEFEARYLCMIEEVSSIRQSSWSDYFSKLRQEINAKSEGSSSPSEEENLSEAISRKDADITRPASGEQSPVATRSSFDEARAVERVKEPEAMDATQSRESEDEGMCTEVVYKTIENTNLHCRQELNSIAPKPVQRSPSPTSLDMLLPFPSRDEPSSNALIARAERKLWTAIDGALAIYSKEVLEIQAAAARTTK